MSPADTSSAEVSSADARIASVVGRASEILEKWSAAGERHERAVDQLETQLSELSAANARLQRETAQKMQELETAVQHEWDGLRALHEAPIKLLTEQANSLTEVCIATAHTARRSFDQAEARLAALEQGLQQQLSDLRRDVQTVVSVLRNNPGLARTGAPQASWPLEGVARLHQQLRQTPETPAEVILLEETNTQAFDALTPENGVIVDVPKVAPPEDVVTGEAGEAEDGGRVDVVAVDDAQEDPATGGSDTHEAVTADTETPAAPVPLVAPAHLPRAAAATSVVAPTVAVTSDVTERLRSLEQALHEREAEAKEVAERARQSMSASRIAMTGMAAVVVLALGFALWLRGQVNQPPAATPPAAESTNEQTTAIREQAASEIAAAREIAARAQTVSAVLAAPDLVRFNLVGRGDFASGSAQALWSRSRGFVLSGTGLGPVPAGRIYQVWLLARGQTISAGTFRPDADGSITHTVPPPATTLPIFSVVVSLEPESGSTTPDGPPVLVRTRLQS